MSQRTAVKYNKKERSWQAINGETHDFGPGKNGKRQALLAAVAYDQPELHSAVLWPATASTAFWAIWALHGLADNHFNGNLVAAQRRLRENGLAGWIHPSGKPEKRVRIGR